MNSLSIELDDNTYARLEDLARRMGLTKEECIREVFLMSHKDIVEEIDVIKERLATPVRRWTHSDIKNGVDLAG